MISFDGKLISYDPQGNPLNYLGHALRWEKGRQLKSFDNNTYTYNASGIRTSKTVDGIRHDYIVDGANILKETWQDNTLIPIYNNLDEVVGIHYNCEPYYFYKNLQGDVIGIANTDGTEVVTYTYDAWGVCTVLKDISGVGLANINPYRYRSYYYDTEIRLYYVSSRYYDPEIGRWVNGDMPEVAFMNDTVNGHNLYGYCENEPISRKDPMGYFAFSISNNYYTLKFNDWETGMIIDTASICVAAVAAILAIVSCIPSAGIGIALAAEIFAGALIVYGFCNLMNKAGGNKGLNINFSRKWYLPPYIGINKSEPQGFHNIFEVFEAVKAMVNQIMKIIGSVIEDFAKKYNSVVNRKHHIIILSKLIYDHYSGKKVKKQNYKII